MAFPKKYTRKITIDNQIYLWHLNGNSLEFGEHHITIRHQQIAGQILYIDPYAWDLEIRPGMIREAILFALENGWLPLEKKAPMYLGFQNEQFILLPEGIEFIYQLKKKS